VLACSDPRLTYLNELGYNVVRLPREGIEPLDVLGVEGSLRENLGAIDRIWVTPAARPAVEGPLDVAMTSGERTRGLDFSVGITVLTSILTGMGAATPDLGWAFRTVRRIQFVFADVHAFAVEPLALGQYLQAGDVNLANPVAARYFTGQETEAYVITEVLKSRSIAVNALDASGRTASLNTAVMSQALGPTIEVGTKSGGQVLFTYRGASALTFGFKAFQVGYEDGRWVARGRRPGADGALNAAGERGALLSRGLLSGDFRRR
jgi:hypothetical protein